MATDTMRGIGSAAQGAAIGTAIAPGVGTAIGGGLGFIGGMLSGDDNAEQAHANLQKAIAQFDAIGIPPDLSGPIIYQQLQAGGRLTPAYQHALASENFAPATIQEQPEDRQNLVATLSALKGMSQGGFNPEQVAAQQQAYNKNNANTQSLINSILNNQAQRGQLNSGDAIAAKLNGVQNGSQNLSQNASDLGANNYKAQMGALQQLMSGQGNLRSQDINVASQNADVMNTANYFKAKNAASRQAANVGAENTANQANWQRQNQTSDYNTQLGNQELLRQQEAKRQNWLDQLSLAQGKANAYTGASNAYANMAGNSNQGWNTLMQGLTSAAGAYNQNQNNKDWLSAYKTKNGLNSSEDQSAALNNMNWNPKVLG